MNDILEQYRQLLAAVDAWFSRSAAIAGGTGGCRGCAECCRGLFDITLLDAALLRRGFDRLPAAGRRAVLEKVRPIMVRLQARWPGFDHPWLLSAIPENEQALPEESDTPCPLCDTSGRCMVYEHRPLTCRMYGLPHVDLSGEIFLDEWCPNAFPGRDPLSVTEIRWHFRRTFSEEGRLLRLLSDRLPGPPAGDLDTLIPTALLLDFDRLLA